MHVNEDSYYLLKCELGITASTNEVMYTKTFIQSSHNWNKRRTKQK